MKYFHLIEKDSPLDDHCIASRHIFFGEFGKRGSRLFTGEVIENWDMNSSIITTGKGGLLDILSSSWSVLIVSDKIKNYLSTIEPNLQFLSVKIENVTVDEGGQNNASYYVVNILEHINDAINVTHSVFDYAGDPIKVFLDYSKLNNRSLFRIKELPWSLFASEEVAITLEKIVPGYYEFIEV